jgi:gas vesicle protein
MSKDSNAGSNLVFFLLGAAVGAAVALLYAPQEGEATRRLIGEKATEMKDKAAEMSSTVAQSAKEKTSQLKEKAGQASDKLSEMLHRGQQDAKEAMDTATDKTRAVVDTISS